MANRPRDLFHLLVAVRHPLANSFYASARRYCAAYDNGYGLDTRGASNLEELAQLVSGVMLRRTKDEALDLPEKVRTWLPVEARGVERALALEERALAYLGEHPARGGPTWVTFLGLLNRSRHALAVAKAPATAGLVADPLEGGHKAVVFTSYTEVVDRFLKEFGAAAVAITGDHSPAQRQAAVDALQGDDSVRLLVGNLKAAGVGINLTAATHVVFNDLDWVPGNHWQAEDRIHRIGQTSATFATYCYTPGTLDGYVAALLEEKARNIGVLEAEVATAASLLEAVVDGALAGGAPREPGVGTDPARTAPAPTLGVLEDTLDLWAEARRASALADPYASDRVITITSRSKPDVTYEVQVAGGVVTCTCPGFSYRGNCTHARDVTTGRG